MLLLIGQREAIKQKSIKKSENNTKYKYVQGRLISLRRTYLPQSLSGVCNCNERKALVGVNLSASFVEYDVVDKVAFAVYAFYLCVLLSPWDYTSKVWARPRIAVYDQKDTQAIHGTEESEGQT